MMPNFMFLSYWFIPENILRITFFSFHNYRINYFLMPGTIKSQYINNNQQERQALILISVNSQVGKAIENLRRETIFQKKKNNGMTYFYIGRVNK